VLSDIVKRRSFRANAGIEVVLTFDRRRSAHSPNVFRVGDFLRKQGFETRTTSVDDASPLIVGSILKQSKVGLSESVFVRSNANSIGPHAFCCYGIRRECRGGNLSACGVGIDNESDQVE
jgi:hypothetical protein